MATTNTRAATSSPSPDALVQAQRFWPVGYGGGRYCVVDRSHPESGHAPIVNDIRDVAVTFATFGEAEVFADSLNRDGLDPSRHFTRKYW
jgi:hypothetical protein